MASSEVSGHFARSNSRSIPQQFQMGYAVLTVIFSNEIVYWLVHFHCQSTCAFDGVMTRQWGAGGLNCGHQAGMGQVRPRPG